LHVGLVVRKPERLTFVLLIDGDPIARTSIRVVAHADAGQRPPG